MDAEEKKQSNKKWWIATLIVFLIGATASQCTSTERFNKTYDHKCDICGEPSTWKLDGHEYCDFHAGHKMNDDFYEKYSK